MVCAYVLLLLQASAEFGRHSLVTKCSSEISEARTEQVDRGEGDSVDAIDVDELSQACAEFIATMLPNGTDDFIFTAAGEGQGEFVDPAVALEELHEEESRLQRNIDVVQGVLLLAGVVWSIAIGIAIFYFTRLARHEALEFERESSRIMSGGSESTPYDRLVEINVKHLDAYYLLVKSQTNNSFAATLVVAIVGFLFIASGMAMVLLSASLDNLTLAQQQFVWISTGSGLIIEFIGGVFFYLYNRTVQQLKGYHASLVKVQNTLLSFNAAEGISEATDAQRARIVEQIVRHLLGQHDAEDNEHSATND